MAGYDRLTPEGKKFLKEIDEMKRLVCHVGFQQGEASGGGASVADIAMFNELGTSNMPSRPFMRQSVEENTEQISAMCKAQLQAIARGASARDALTALGVMQKGLIQNQIVSGSFAPNAKATVKMKGSAQPLINSGRMRQSVTFTVEEKGSG
jgi:hypothetical protein